MKENFLASIIINNYNYERFLGEAIDSAIDQNYRNVEVIVVDDGSTDSSREIMAGYGDKIIQVLKPNGGQASAFNAGFSNSLGEVIIFLDSDDVLFPTAVQCVMEVFTSQDIAKVHWPLSVIDEQGIETGERTPKFNLSEGDFCQHALKSGPPFCQNPPTSGNAWSRHFISSIMPIPENDFKLGTDTYLFEMAPFFGPIKRIKEPQAGYRIHSGNNFANRNFSDKLQFAVKFYDDLFNKMENYCHDLGLDCNRQLWHSKSWFHQLELAVQEIKHLAPEESTIILVDDSTWGAGESLCGRQIFPFIEKNRLYVGPPVDDAKAIKELERLRNNGADYIVVAWASFWWLEHYSKFHQHLRDHFNCVLENERLIIFDLKAYHDK